ncbi:hypothetical protein RSAG8_11954, partial [Rhizoctonia solani AG-8 WAC10335]
MTNKPPVPIGSHHHGYSVRVITITMLEDLKNAGDNLRSALVRYITVCSKLRGRTLQDRVSHGTSRELDDQIRKEVEYFDQYETQLQGALHSLRVARNSARSIAPINALPAEILVHIFHLVSGSRIRTIKHLTHVCSQWRSVSLSCCSLWTQINYCPREDPALQPKLLDQVRTYLFRVGQLPLRISICLGNFPDKFSVHRNKVLVRVLCSSYAGSRAGGLPCAQI